MSQANTDKSDNFGDYRSFGKNYQVFKQQANAVARQQNEIRFG